MLSNIRGIVFQYISEIPTWSIILHIYKALLIYLINACYSEDNNLVVIYFIGRDQAAPLMSKRSICAVLALMFTV